MGAIVIDLLPKIIDFLPLIQMFQVLTVNVKLKEASTSGCLFFGVFLHFLSVVQDVLAHYSLF